jgi:hypothetical protein
VPIDWTDPKSQVTTNFTVHELTYLPSWQIWHLPNEIEQANLIRLATKMEEIRDYIERPINVHVTIRPVVVNSPGSGYNGRNYNALVGGAPHSAHILGLAMDFNPYSMMCDECRVILQYKLEEFDIRMENRDGNWVHLDLIEPLPGGKRFFKP